MQISTIIGWLVFGLIVGAVARFLTPGRNNMGCLMTALLGIGGSLLGGYIGHELTGRPKGYFQASYLFSILGAIALLLIGRLLSSRK